MSAALTFRKRKENFKSSCAYVLHKTLNVVISEEGKEMYQSV